MSMTLYIVTLYIDFSIHDLMICICMSVELGVVYIMDHEVVPCSPKICDWSLDSSEDHFGLDQGENS